jgi:hypothetical protein
MIKKTGLKNDGKSFLDFLAVTDNDEILSIPIIETMISYIWKVYFYKIRKVIFVPYVIYSILFLVYVSSISE